MRTIFLNIVAIALFLGTVHPILPDEADISSAELIEIRLKNNSLLPRQFKLISYDPESTGNNAQTFFLLPGTSKSLKFHVGTRLYLATQRDINTVMSGKALTTKPWHVVKREDSKSPIPLVD